MQTMKDYSGDRAPVKPATTGTGQRVECRINTRRGTLRLAGSMAEVTGWLRAQCPGGKLCELVEVQ